MSRRVFQRDVALQVAEELGRLLATTCTRIQVVGSVRRGRKLVHDLDVLAFEKTAGGLRARLLVWQTLGTAHLLPGESDGSKLRFVHCATGIPVDLHLVASIEDWWGKLVIFTGSMDWLSRVRREVHKKVFALHDDGRVELTRGRFAEVRSEKGIFRALRIPYVSPEERC